MGKYCMKQSTNKWLDAATDDLRAIERLLPDESLANIIAFHCQQAIEKVLKALIEETSLGLTKTHNLQSLLLKTEDKFNLEYDEFVIAEIDRLYIDSRYPGDLGLMPYGKPTTMEITLYYDQAKKLKGQVEKILAKIVD
jgi:HEPN domain-containing protein